MSTCGDLFLALLGILFPPLPVWVKRGICSVDSMLNILLFILGYLPGLIHSWYIIAKYPDEYEPLQEDYESGRVTYYYVSRDPLPSPQPGPAASGAPDGGRAHRELQRGPSYGAIRAQSQSQAQAQAHAPHSAAAAASQPPAPEAEASATTNPPPSYAEAIQGDHKVQGP